MSTIVPILGSLLLSQVEFMRVLECGKQLQSLLEGFSLEELLGMRSEVPSLPLVMPYGSCVAGTAFKDADVDYTVVFVPRTCSTGFGSHKVRLAPSCFLDVEREHHHEILSSILKHIEKVDPLWCVNNDRIFQARVPIIRLKKPIGTFNVDHLDITLSLNGLRNSTLLRFYMQSDSRLRAGALCAKKWGRSQRILNARQGWISPYAVTIMYIFYMQQTGRTRCIIDENKVDELFSIVSKEIVSATNETNRTRMPVFNEVLPFQCVNESQILEDLHNFFVFFSDPSGFDFDADVVDIRTKNKLISKESWLAELSELTDKARWDLLGYETIMVRDPFETHNLGRSVDFFRAEGIRETFRLAAEKTPESLGAGNSLFATL